MTGIGIILPGTGPGTGPIVPTALPSPGVSGYSHRLSGQRLVGSDGAAISGWIDSGSSPLVTSVIGSGTALINRTSQAFPYAALTGNAVVVKSTSDAGVGTVCAVLAHPTSGTVAQFLTGLGYQVKLASSLQAIGGATYSSGLLPGTGWAFVLLAADGAGAVTMRVNGSEASGTAAVGTQPLQVGVSNTSTVNNVAEFIKWDRVLNSTERAAVYAALKAAYPVVP